MYKEVKQYLDTDPDPNVTDMDWVVLKRRRFVRGETSPTGGCLLLEEPDVLDTESPAIARQYTWGVDLTGQMGGAGILLASLEGAGTIGGLLAEVWVARGPSRGTQL